MSSDQKLTKAVQSLSISKQEDKLTDSEKECWAVGAWVESKLKPSNGIALIKAIYKEGDEKMVSIVYERNYELEEMKFSDCTPISTPISKFKCEYTIGDKVKRENYEGRTIIGVIKKISGPCCDCGFQSLTLWIYSKSYGEYLIACSLEDIEKI